MKRFVPLSILMALTACSRATIGWRPSLVSQVPDSTPVRFSLTLETPIVTGRALGWQRGAPRLITARGDTVVVPSGAVLSIRLPGKTRHAGTGAIVGAAVGLMVALANCNAPEYCDQQPPYQLFFSAPGALIGYAIRTDHWIRIAWDPTPSR